VQLLHPPCDPRRAGGDRVLAVKAHWWWMMQRLWGGAAGGGLLSPRASLSLRTNLH
jgi:hypothetical protein